MFMMDQNIISIRYQILEELYKDDTEEVIQAFKIKDPIVTSVVSSTIVNNNIELKILSDIENNNFKMMQKY